jgi:hypothetical protein
VLFGTSLRFKLLRDLEILKAKFFQVFAFSLATSTSSSNALMTYLFVFAFLVSVLFRNLRNAYSRAEVVSTRWFPPLVKAVSIMHQKFL